MYQLAPLQPSDGIIRLHQHVISHPSPLSYKKVWLKERLAEVHPFLVHKWVGGGRRVKSHFDLALMYQPARVALLRNSPGHQIPSPAMILPRLQYHFIARPITLLPLTSLSDFVVIWFWCKSCKLFYSAHNGLPLRTCVYDLAFSAA